MNKLGYFEHPEQYSDVDDDCLIADSVQARNYFLQTCETEGFVFLTKLLYASLNNAFLPVWSWVDIKNATIMQFAPVFRLKNPDFYSNLQLLEYKFMNNNFYFRWDTKLYVAMFTSNAEIGLRRVRAILTEVERINIALIDGYENIESCKPVKVYDRQDGHFVAVCWVLEIGNSLWYDAVCKEDSVLLQQLDDENIISYPINIGEKVIIGNNFFICSFLQQEGIFFEITPILATEQDRRNEDIPLPQKAEPFRPELKVFVHEKKAPKERHRPKIIAFNFKK